MGLAPQHIVFKHGDIELDGLKTAADDGLSNFALIKAFWNMDGHPEDISPSIRADYERLGRAVMTSHHRSESHPMLKRQRRDPS